MNLHKKTSPPWVAGWLFSCAVCVLVMVVIGGVTRLTGSGLSIVEWRPIIGVLPPWTEADWVLEFAKYQQHSEFIKHNSWMGLADFKQIYWLEYIHRLWGRVLGLVVIVPLIVFAWKRMISPAYVVKVLLLVSLGALQGFLGWWMVKSGLGNDPHVSPYRLTLHLIMAAGIIAGFLHLAVRLLPSEISLSLRGKNPFLKLLALAVLTLIYGGLVAGHKAGLLYNTFPLMGGHWFPEDGLILMPIWRNLYANPGCVQWIHRCLAILLVLSVFWQTWICHHTRVAIWYRWLSVLVLCQVCLGILTLLHHVPVVLGVLHQALGVSLVGILYIAVLLGSQKIQEHD